MNKRDDKIAIIGGGISGLVIAAGLQKKGYKNVTLFEKHDRLGGKLNTIRYKGRSYEFGALFGLPSQIYLKTLMKDFNIKSDGPKLSRVNYDVKGNKIMQIPKEDLGTFVEELYRLPDVLSQYQSLENINIHYIESPIMLPFSKWCDLHQFKVLKAVYSHHFTSYGLGDIDTVPAIYVLKILNYDNLMSFMELPEFFTWKEGISTLVESLQEEIRDVRLKQNVSKITLSENSKLQLHTDFAIHQFNQVIITSPLHQYAELYEEDQVMVDFLSSIKYHDFIVYAFIADKAPKGCGCVLENLSIDKRGHVMIWNCRWDSCDGEVLLMVYAYDHPHKNKHEAIKVIEGDLIKLGVVNPRLYQLRHWKQSPYVDTDILQKGFYEKMEAMQGKKNVFFAGEIMSTVTIDNCIQYANYLINKYF